MDQQYTNQNPITINLNPVNRHNKKAKKPIESNNPFNDNKQAERNTDLNEDGLNMGIVIPHCKPSQICLFPNNEEFTPLNNELNCNEQQNNQKFPSVEMPLNNNEEALIMMKCQKKKQSLFNINENNSEENKEDQLQINNNEKPIRNSLINVSIPISIKNLAPTQPLVDEQALDDHNNNNAEINGNDFTLDNLNSIGIKKHPIIKGNDQQIDINPIKILQKPSTLLLNKPFRKKKKKQSTQNVNDNNNNNDQVIQQSINPEIDIHFNNLQHIPNEQEGILLVENNGEIMTMNNDNNHDGNELNNYLIELLGEQRNPNIPLRQKKKKIQAAPLDNELELTPIDNSNDILVKEIQMQQEEIAKLQAMNIAPLQKEINNTNSNPIEIPQDQLNPNIPLRKKKKKKQSSLNVNDLVLQHNNQDNINLHQQDGMVEEQDMNIIPLPEEIKTINNIDDYHNNLLQPIDDRSNFKINSPLKRKKKKKISIIVPTNGQILPENNQKNIDFPLHIPNQQEEEITLQNIEKRDMSLKKQTQNQDIQLSNPEGNIQYYNYIHQQQDGYTAAQHIKSLPKISEDFNNDIKDNINSINTNLTQSPIDFGNSNINITQKKKIIIPLNNDQIIQGNLLDYNNYPQQIPIQQEDIPPVKDIYHLSENTNDINNNNLLQMTQDQDNLNMPLRKKKQKHALLDDNNNNHINELQDNSIIKPQHEGITSNSLNEDKNSHFHNNNGNLIYFPELKLKDEVIIVDKNQIKGNIPYSTTIINNQQNIQKENYNLNQDQDQLQFQPSQMKLIKKKISPINEDNVNSDLNSNIPFHSNYNYYINEKSKINLSNLPLNKMPSNRSKSLKVLDQRLIDFQHDQETNNRSIQTTPYLLEYSKSLNKQSNNNNDLNNNKRDQLPKLYERRANKQQTYNRSQSVYPLNSNELLEESRILQQQEQEQGNEQDNHNSPKKNTNHHMKQRKKLKEVSIDNGINRLPIVDNTIYNKNENHQYSYNNNGESLNKQMKKQSSLKELNAQRLIESSNEQNQIIENGYDNYNKYKSSQSIQFNKNTNGNQIYSSSNPNINNQKEQEMIIEHKEKNNINTRRNNNKRVIDDRKHFLSSSTVNDLMKQSRPSINSISNPNNHYFIGEYIHIDLISNKKKMKIPKQSINPQAISYYNDKYEKDEGNIKVDMNIYNEDINNNKHSHYNKNIDNKEKQIENEKQHINKEKDVYKKEQTGQEEETQSLIRQKPLIIFNQPYKNLNYQKILCQTESKNIKYANIPYEITYESRIILKNKYHSSVRKQEIHQELKSIVFKYNSLIRRNIAQRKELHKLSRQADYQLSKMNLTHFAAKVISLKKQQSNYKYMSIDDNQIMNAKSLAYILQRENFRLHQISSYPNLNLLQIQSEDYETQIDQLTAKIKRLKHNKKDHEKCWEMNHDILKSLWIAKDELRISDITNDDLLIKIKELQRRIEKATLYHQPITINSTRKPLSERRNRSCEQNNTSISMTEFQYPQGISMFTNQENSYLQEAFIDNKGNYNRLMKSCISIQNTNQSKDLQYQIKINNEAIKMNELSLKIINLQQQMKEAEEMFFNENKLQEEIKENTMITMRKINEIIENIEQVNKEIIIKNNEIQELNSQITLCKRIRENNEKKLKKQFQ